MLISGWVKKRKQKGTLADIARRIVERDRPYREAVRSLQQLCALESLIKTGFDQQKTAEMLGVSPRTIVRIISPLGMAEARRAAKAIRQEEAK